jgi:hypothetical protein
MTMRGCAVLLAALVVVACPVTSAAPSGVFSAQPTPELAWERFLEVNRRRINPSNQWFFRRLDHPYMYAFTDFAFERSGFARYPPNR